MDASRHAFALEPIEVLPDVKGLLIQATSYEETGNWLLAGETYRELARQIGKGDTLVEDHARALTRAAVCFEAAGLARAAARAYFDAAMLLDNKRLLPQTAGELYNRAALAFRGIAEFFNAGDAWRRGAECFARVPSEHVVSKDNLPPVPGGAHRFTVAGDCYVAAGDAFLRANDNDKWACRSYWEAGQMFTKLEYGGYGAFVAFRKALTAGARLYRTHDRDAMRKYLPLTDQERAAKVDPMKMMEAEALRSNTRHQQMNQHIYDSTWPRAQTDREMMAAYQEFYLAFLSIGNLREASICRSEKLDRLRKTYLAEGRHAASAAYTAWKVVAGYGESLGRWVITCVVVVLTFALLYGVGSLIEPVESSFDPVYFSVITFTSLGYGDIHPVGVFGKVLACTEIVLGLVMFGFLLTLISTRAQRSGPGA